ncbi:MAG: GAF domain-containing protein, partial [Anaerolineae bacterium]|nr:GAF domain-containing protein [Anaerolineae bacterium]
MTLLSSPGVPVEPEWKQFLQLEEQLVRKADTPSQCLAVEKTVVRILGGTAQIWLARPSYPLPGDPEMELLPVAQAPDLVHRAHLEKESYFSDAENQPSTQPASPTWQAALVLNTNETFLGVLYHERSPEQPYQTEEIDLLTGLAAHAALAFEISRQEKVKNWRLQQLGLVRQVSAQIANLLNIDLLCKRVTELIQETFHYYYVAIFTLDENSSGVQFRSSASLDDIQPFETGFSVPIGEGLIGFAASSGEIVITRDALIDPRFRYYDALPETLSEACFPLKIEQRVLGVLDLQSNMLDGFHETDILVLSSLADSIALAVQTAHLYTDLEMRAGQLSIVAEFSHILNSILEIDELLSEVVQFIQRRFGFPYVNIFSVHSGRRLAIYQAGSGERSAAMGNEQLSYSLDAPTGIIAHVARTGVTLLANDVSQEPLYLPSPMPPHDTRAELTLPIQYGDEVQAVLDIQSNVVNAFSESTVSLFETLASTIAVAYHNASLYRSEKWRRQVAESFRDIAYQISNNVDLESLLDAILDRLERNLPCDTSAIWLVDQVGEASSLRLAAARGVDSTMLNHVVEEKPDVANSLLMLVQREEPFIRNANDALGPLGHALNYDPDYSALVAPMRAGNQVLGLLVLAHHTSGRYGSEASSMTATFASYAAVAIQNNRLFHESQEQAWVATMLVQVAEASQSVLSVTDLLATMLRLTRLLVGVRKCAFLLRMEGQPYYELKAWYGFEPNNGSQHIFPITLPGLVRLEQERSLIMLEDPAMEIGLPEAALSGYTLHTLLPLLLRGEVTGAFLVAAQLDGFSINPPRPDPKSSAILQGIAHQTSVTVENLRLLEARQEEAYVTAALLQVAQAVVSANELPEVLDNIVHLLPILVGIDVCLVYRWDEDLQVFRPTNAHGENRRQERFLLDNPYLPGEHHLLDAVLNTAAAHICSMPQEGLPAEDWPLLPCEPLDSYDLTIHSTDQDWLLGFPLTVQANVKGVFVVRERSASPAFRERRLEILTGIAQQTSLALQNDLVKREMVQNERIEREIQLARQIQETFLPERLPSYSGWEIDIRWQTARQVGGDFYDVFPLDNNRVGLVVADVSDKGLPAALYMTVARTLIRASVRDHAEPARVLEEV